MDEKSPLLPDASTESPVMDKIPQAVAVSADGPGSPREWDGHLLKMCGNCDQDGLSTFAYVKLLSPLAYGHNFKRAFGGGFWKHCIIFALLFTTWGYYFIGASSRVAVACGPNPPAHPDWRPDFKEPRAELPEPRDQQILTGATLNPEFMNEQQKAEWVDLEGTEETEGAFSLPEDESHDDEQLVMNQIQTAKVQAAEGMAQLGAGRKLLHKHKHDDDHEHDDDDDDDHKKKGGHKHKDEEHDDSDKEEKKEKDGHKKGKHGKKDGKNRAPRDKMLDGPKHGPESPECEEAQTSLGAVFMLTLITFFVGITYATRMRTALRERFGIKGSKCGDCVAWSFCAPCALCQETRTIAKNNVYNGVWHGQTVLTEAPGQPLEAPTQIEAPTKPV